MISGFRYLYSNFYTSTEPDIINFLECPAQAADFILCSFDTTNSGECASHYYDANIQCYNSELLRTLANCGSIYLSSSYTFTGSTLSIPECFIDGQVRIAHNTTSNSTEYEEISGVLEICVDESYERVCGNEDASLNATLLVETACSDIGYRGVVNT